MTLVRLDRIQDEQRRWVAHNFPIRRQYEPVLGACEEFFEAQNALGDREKWLDAVADCSLYLFDLASMRDLQISAVLQLGRTLDIASDRPWQRHLGALTHHFLKFTQGVRGPDVYHTAAINNAVGGILATCERDVVRVGEDYIQLLERVWSEVRQRDWRTYPLTGFPPAASNAENP